MGRLLIIILTAFAVQVQAATWHVDRDAAGSNAGSEANPWTSQSNIVWASISPGDTIVMHAGNYWGHFNIGKSGSAASGRITITNAGEVIFTNGSLTIGAYDYLTVSTPLLGAGLKPTQVFQTASNAANCGMRFLNVVAETGASAAGIYLSGTPNDITIEFVQASNIVRNAASTGKGTEGGQAVHGVWANQTSGGVSSNVVMRYCDIAYPEDDGVAWYTNDPAVQHGQQEFYLNHIHHMGDDGFEANHGWIVRDNIIGPSRAWHGHPDGIQTAGSYWKIYNNVFYEFLNAFVRVQALQTNHHSVLLFNNLFISGKSPTNEITWLRGTAIEMAQYAEGALGEMVLMVWSNVVVAHNTMFVTNDTAASGNGLTWSKRQSGNSWARNVLLTNSIVANNIWRGVHSGAGISWQAWKTGAPWGTLVNYLPENVPFDFNNVSGTTWEGSASLVGYMGTAYATGEAMAAGEIWDANTSIAPKFRDPENWDFELAADDTAALHTGTNLASWGISFDILNRPRSSTPSRGAFETQDTNLLVWLRFEDDFSDGTLDDSSGNGNHAHRFGRSGSTYPTNFPTKVPVTLSTGSNSVGYAGQFAWFTNEYGLYSRDGQYGAITNVGALTNLNQMTIAVWARFWRYSSNAYGCIDYTCDQQAALLSAGTSTGVPGTWELARRDFDTGNHLRFQVLTNQSTFARHEVHYPDPGFPGQTDGDTLAWHHYAATWSNGVLRTFFDGTNHTTHDISGVVTNLTVAWNNNVAPANAFVGVGCNTHGGTPTLEDEAGGPDYPNHGWFNGLMDDVRIMRAAASDAQIAAWALRPPSGGVGLAGSPGPGRPQARGRLF